MTLPHQGPVPPGIPHVPDAGRALAPQPRGCPAAQASLPRAQVAPVEGSCFCSPQAVDPVGFSAHSWSGLCSGDCAVGSKSPWRETRPSLILPQLCGQGLQRAVSQLAHCSWGRNPGLTPPSAHSDPWIRPGQLCGKLGETEAELGWFPEHSSRAGPGLSPRTASWPCHCCTTEAWR